MQSEEHFQEFDLAIIGSGFHGVSLAREACRCGLKVAIVHEHTLIDCPTAPSQAVLGGDIGKLETFNFTEVIANQQALNHLQKHAPHLISKIPIFISENSNIRSARRIKFGVRAYRGLQKKAESGSRVNSQPSTLNPKHLIGIEPTAIHPEQINDFLVQPKRLLIGIARDAINYGVIDFAYHFVKKGTRDEKNWTLHLVDKKNGDEKQMHAKAIINCASNAIDKVLHDTLSVKTRCQSKSIQCAWIYINKPQQWPFGIMLQLKNLTLPYVFSANATTLCAGPIIVESDQPMDKQLAINNFLEELNGSTNFTTTVDDIVRCEWHAESVFDDLNSKINAAYNEAYLDLNNAKGLAPVLSIFGTNIAQSTKVATESLHILSSYFPKIRNSSEYPGTEKLRLFSRDISELSELQIQNFLLDKLPLLDAQTLMRMYHSYGPVMEHFLEGFLGATEASLLGQHFGHGLYAVEVDHLMKNEWVETAEELLWRNTNLGLVFNTAEKQLLSDYLSRNSN